MASLWAVADGSTAAMMADFYRRQQRKPGMTKAAALQDAQLALLTGKNIGADQARCGTRTSDPLDPQMALVFLALFALLTPHWLSASQAVIAFGQSPQRNTEADRIHAEANAALKEGTMESGTRALDLFERAARLHGAVGDKQREAACLLGAAVSARKLGKFDLIVKFSTDALPAIQAAKQTDIEAVTWENIGLAWSALGEKSSASARLYWIARNT
jgi:hypothetical protein